MRASKPKTTDEGAKEVTLEEYQDALKEQDVDRIEDIKHVCPSCGTVQTPQDLIDAGAGESMDDVREYVGFSCVGRWTDEKGCDWTLGGLLQIHDLVVIDEEEGTRHPRFMPTNLSK